MEFFHFMQGFLSSGTFDFYYTENTMRGSLSTERGINASFRQQGYPLILCPVFDNIEPYQIQDKELKDSPAA